MRTGNGKRRDGVCPSPEGFQIRLTLLVISSCGVFVQGGWVQVRGYFSGQYVTDKNLIILSFTPHSFNLQRTQLTFKTVIIRDLLFMAELITSMVCTMPP